MYCRLLLPSRQRPSASGSPQQLKMLVLRDLVMRGHSMKLFGIWLFKKFLQITMPPSTYTQILMNMQEYRNRLSKTIQYQKDASTPQISISSTKKSSFLERIPELPKVAVLLVLPLSKSFFIQMPYLKPIPIPMPVFRSHTTKVSFLPVHWYTSGFQLSLQVKINISPLPLFPISMASMRNAPNLQPLYSLKIMMAGSTPLDLLRKVVKEVPSRVELQTLPQLYKRQRTGKYPTKLLNSSKVKISEGYESVPKMVLSLIILLGSLASSTYYSFGWMFSWMISKKGMLVSLFFSYPYECSPEFCV